MDTTKRKSIQITNKTNGNKDEPNINFMWEKGNFEDTKGVIRSRISKKDRQYNGQRQTTKGQTTIYKT